MTTRTSILALAALVSAVITTVGPTFALAGGTANGLGKDPADQVSILGKTEQAFAEINIPADGKAPGSYVSAELQLR